jgi:hypothetical protein
MKKALNKFILYMLGLLMIINPYFALLQNYTPKAKADTEDDSSANIDYNVDDASSLTFADGFTEPAPLAVPPSFQNLTSSWAE